MTVCLVVWLLFFGGGEERGFQSLLCFAFSSLLYFFFVFFKNFILSIKSVT